jgi:hypothetical protein
VQPHRGHPARPGNRSDIEAWIVGEIDDDEAIARIKALPR